LSRVPLRLKLTLAFAGLMALVLTALGGFVYLRFASDLDASLDRNLRTRADDVTALVREADSGLTEAMPTGLRREDESFAQVLDGRGEVVDATPPLGRRPLLDADQLRRTTLGPLTFERYDVLEPGDPVRLLATPVLAEERRLVVVVGASLDDSEEALESLLALFLVGGPVALALASLAGYGVAAAALRPVEAMRRRAAEIGEAEPGRRLPVPAADDEIARLGDTLNAMLARLEAAFDRERTFVSDASHELRTPLAILKTELELALRAGRSPEELREALQSAAEETDRLAQLAEDLLVIARSDQGRLPIRTSSVMLADLLESVRVRFASRAEGRTITVDVPGELRVRADPLQLEQALGNLVDNALRYGEGEVRIEAESTGDRVILRVRDEGEGFPADFAATAFERFTRADTARTRGGSGLGLAIVHAIAEAHGGRAAAAALSEGGAEVSVELPAGAVHGEEGRLPQPVPGTQAESG